MITLDLNKALLNLDDSEFKENGVPVMIGQLLGTLMAQTNKGEPIKYMDWAKLMYKGEAVLVDESDYKKIYEFVEHHESLPNITKSQVLKLMSDSKENSKK